jgi:hypothetical protein
MDEKPGKRCLSLLSLSLTLPRSHPNFFLLFSKQYHTALRIETITTVGGGAGQTPLSFPNGISYTATTPGPNNCWRADISLQV